MAITLTNMSFSTYTHVMALFNTWNTHIGFHKTFCHSFGILLSDKVNQNNLYVLYHFILCLESSPLLTDRVQKTFITIELPVLFPYLMY